MNLPPQVRKVAARGLDRAGLLEPVRAFRAAQRAQRQDAPLAPATPARPAEPLDPVVAFRRKARRHRREHRQLLLEALALTGLSEDDAKRFVTRGMPQSRLFMTEIIPVLHRLYLDEPTTAVKRILDVGPQNFAGTALLAELHARNTWTQITFEVTAIDIVKAFSELRHVVAPTVDFIHGDIFDLEPGSFDTVIASHVIEHVPDPHAFAKGLQAAARDHVVVACPWQEALPLTRGHVNQIDASFVEAVGGQNLTVYNNYSWGKLREVCIFTLPGTGAGPG